MSDHSRISVIVPTLAEYCRTNALRRAIESIRSSSTEAVRIIVVVNGNRFDTDVCTWLKRQADIRFEQIADASSPLAQKRGRELVSTEYFSFLDDDDEYLPGATDRKLHVLNENIATDYVVCNGFKTIAEVDKVLYDGMVNILDNPLAALFRQNWLASCNVMFRTATVPVAFFDNAPPYAEWTWLAFCLAMAGKRLAVLDEPGFRINDTPCSLSKSEAYDASYLGLYQRMLAASPPAHIARTIEVRIGSAWHGRSVTALAKGKRLAALTCHVRSLLQPGGLRYLSYSRRLLPGWPVA